MEGASIIENMESEVSAKEYYLRKDFLEAMEPWLFGREIWITNAPRPLYASNTDELRDLIERYSPEGPGPFSLLFSVETFSDPPRLGTESPDSLRITWDFFLDIDAEDFQAAKLAASKALKTLRLFGVRNFLLKFSGRRGFHLVIPGLSLDIFGPGEFRAAYPRLAIGLARWFEAVMGEPSVKVDLGVYKPRQMMRAPYSLHERTGLASVPVEDPGTFKVEDARIEVEGARISKERAFPKGEAGEAEALLFSLRDWLKGHRREPQNGIKIVRQPLGDEKPGAYGWVEGLLDNPLDDGRHRLLWLVVAPYLVNVKRLSRHEAKTIARNWLTECNRKKPIEGDMNRLAAYYIDYAARTGIKPLSLKAIRTKPEYKELWEILSKVIPTPVPLRLLKIGSLARTEPEYEVEASLLSEIKTLYREVGRTFEKYPEPMHWKEGEKRNMLLGWLGEKVFDMVLNQFGIPHVWHHPLIQNALVERGNKLGADFTVHGETVDVKVSSRVNPEFYYINLKRLEKTKPEILVFLHFSSDFKRAWLGGWLHGKELGNFPKEELRYAPGYRVGALRLHHFSKLLERWMRGERGRW